MTSALRASLLLAGVWLLLGIVAGGTPVAHADVGTNISIQFPASAEGPVGTNVTIQAQGLTVGDSYLLGYTQAGADCTVGFTKISNTSYQPLSDGRLPAPTTFVWPQSADAVGASYSLCLVDQTQLGNPPVQSQQAFKVDAAAPVKITLSRATPTPGSGTPAVSPTSAPSSKAFNAGDTITVQGTNFYPGGTTVQVYLTQALIQKQSDLGTQPLATTGDMPIVTDEQGRFTASVVLPSDFGDTSLPANFYLYVVSADGGGAALPSLVAHKEIIISPALTPTPTVTPSPTSTTKAGPTGPTNPGDSSSGPKNLTAVIVLGGLSVVLFVIGVILLASAAAMPRSAR